MFVPGQNRLPEPSAVAVKLYEEQLVKFKETVIALVTEHDPDLVELVRQTLENEAEIGTKIIEAATVVLQTRIREVNEQALQMLAYWAIGDNLDAKVSDLGLVRQEIEPGDLGAFPQIPPTMESDEHLKLRYFLAPHAPAAGSNQHYRFEVMSLGDRPVITVESPEKSLVVVSYKFEDGGWGGKVKSANGIRTSPGVVSIPVLSHEGDGTPSNDLLTAVAAHFKDRDDTAPKTDDIYVVPAEIIEYSITGKVFVNRGADGELVRQTCELACAEYAKQQHELGVTILGSMLDHVLHGAGAVEIALNNPVDDIVCNDFQAPFCTKIELTVETR